MMGMLELFVGEHVETTTCLISSISTGLPLDLLHSRGITLSWNLQTTLLWVSIIFMFSTWAFFSWSCSWASYRPWEVWGLSVEHKINGISEDYFFRKIFPYSLSGDATYWPKNAFLDNFFDDARSEELRNKISTFFQGPTEAFKVSWIRLKHTRRIAHTMVSLMFSCWTSSSGV